MADAKADSKSAAAKKDSNGRALALDSDTAVSAVGSTSRFDAGEAHEREGRRSEAFRLFEEMHNAGERRATLKLARYYFSGFNVVKIDLPKAFALASQAHEAGVPGAAVVLARLYEDGDGVRKDMAKAIDLLLPHAATDPVARLALHTIDKQKFAPPSSQEVSDLRKMATRGGDPAAENRWGFMFGEGIGVKKDDAEGATWFRKAADSGEQPRFPAGSLSTEILGCRRLCRRAAQPRLVLRERRRRCEG